MINRRKISLEGRTIYSRYVGLRDADLREADLEGIKLVDAALEGADLENADSTNADLRGADLQDANLKGATLKGCDFRAFVPADASEIVRTDLQAKGLKPEQLEQALGDIWTQLPGYMKQRPEAWVKNPAPANDRRPEA